MRQSLCSDAAHEAWRSATPPVVGGKAAEQASVKRSGDIFSDDVFYGHVDMKLNIFDRRRREDAYMNAIAQLKLFEWERNTRPFRNIPR